MHPIFNEPACFFASAKTHKFNKIKDIDIQDLELRPILTKLALVYIILPK